MLNRRQLLQALVEPSARISPGFGNISVILKNNQQVQGTLLEDTDSYLVIRTDGEKSQKIFKKNIAQRANDPSAMPPMGSILNKDQIRNLVEFLSNEK